MAGAAALLGSAHLPLALAAQQMAPAGGKPVSVNLPAKPKDLFASTFTPEMLSRTLISAKDWHPYPKAAEREAWQQVPKEFADALTTRAEKAIGAPWESFPATIFMEYKTNGNRSHFESYYFRRRNQIGRAHV